jgi:glucose/arabinose dehydrogenase
LTVADLPAPFASPSAGNGPKLAPQPEGAWPQVPAGFKVERYVGSGLDEPRELRTAPNGDLFVAESHLGQVKIFRGITPDGKPVESSVFAGGFTRPFGIAFYPPGKSPQWVYVANTSSVVRFPYKNGDLQASGAPETVIAEIPAGGGHWTRDLAFTADGKTLFISVGSQSNVNDPDTHPQEFHRANILEFTPEGKFIGIFASGIRNPVGIAIDPQTKDLWCSTNERDELGDNLVPDYITHVQRGGFYGWPWFYMGSNQDPRHAGKHPELIGKVLVPDVLLQPHNASLQLTFYDGKQFPKAYSGDLFASEHGSWNRAVRTGYEVIRVPLEHGRSSGVYEEFMTGFVVDDGHVWGRPVGIAVAPDGSLMVSDDGSRSIWRISYAGK